MRLVWTITSKIDAEIGTTEETGISIMFARIAMVAIADMMLQVATVVNLSPMRLRWFFLFFLLLDGNYSF